MSQNLQTQPLLTVKLTDDFVGPPVQCGLFPGTSSFPLVVIANGLDPVEWGKQNVHRIQSLLMHYGALLLRGFAVSDINTFGQFTTSISSQRLQYRERSSPRVQVGDNIYTSTEYPASESIFLHNENSYQSTWPLKLFFYCALPAQRGGETPLASCRRILNAIHADVSENFLKKQVMYVRNFGEGFGLPWETVFQTNEREQVEAYCHQAGIIPEWKPGNKLRTRQIRPAITRHPQADEPIWFNHATFFHITTLDPVIQRVLRANFKEQDLPSNSYYGDGTPIPTAVMDHLRTVYHQETIAFAWQQNDILLLDNMLTAHGRHPFVGPRKVLVAMSEPWSEQESG